MKKKIIALCALEGELSEHLKNLKTNTPDLKENFSLFTR